MMSTRPRRCYIGDLEMKENVATNTATTGGTAAVRIMGKVTSVLPLMEDDDANSGCMSSRQQNDQTYDGTAKVEIMMDRKEPNVIVGYQFLLDDGTGSVEIFVQRVMYRNLTVKVVGETIDCIARKSSNRCKTKSSNSNGSESVSSSSSSSSSCLWIAEMILIVTDPHCELLRWKELNHSICPNKPNETRQWGYPCFQVNSYEVYRLILNQATIDNGNDGGVSLEDLTLVLQRPYSVIETMIQELQIAGQIYQNDKGLFVPL